MLSCFGAGMVLNEEKRARLADALARRQGALGVAGASASFAPISAHAAPSPAPSAPIVAVPLVDVRASPAPAPLEKDKGVVKIESDGDKDTVEGPVFKRRKAVVAATSYSTTMGHPTSFRDHPPNTSPPHSLLTLEGGGESAPGDEQTPPAPEFPAVLQHVLKGFQRGQQRT